MADWAACRVGFHRQQISIYLSGIRRSPPRDEESAKPGVDRGSAAVQGNCTGRTVSCFISLVRHDCAQRIMMRCSQERKPLSRRGRTAGENEFRVCIVAMEWPGGRTLVGWFGRNTILTISYLLMYLNLLIHCYHWICYLPDCLRELFYYSTKCSEPAVTLVMLTCYLY